MASATRAIFELYRDGRVKPHISERRPPAETPYALAMVAGGRSTGQVIILPRS